ncbi:hypothetical protein MMC14_004194 [Varicellaria rhodocarpa]|nr:hypothetical protein [Varicellaria rhodocarpa]
MPFYLSIFSLNLRMNSHKDKRVNSDLFYEAVKTGDLSYLGYVLDKNPNLLVSNFQDSDILQSAAKEVGNIKVVQLLLDHGANVNGGESDLGNALTHASRAGNLDIMRLLLSYGADIEGRALITAIAEKKGNVVDFLLQNGVDVNAPGKKIEDDDAYDGHYGNALQAAAHKGSEEMVKRLLDAGADVNAIAGFCGTALTTAAAFGRLDAVRVLLAAGADVNIQTRFWKDAMNAARFIGHLEIVRILKEAGARY